MSSYYTQYSDEELKNKLKAYSGQMGRSASKVKSGVNDELKARADGALERGNPGVKGGDADYGQNRDGSIRKQPKASEQLKIHKQQTSGGQSKWSQLDGAGKIAAGAGAAASVLNTLDMLTGGQDTILPGIGHTEVGYNPDMYIGRGV